MVKHFEKKKFNGKISPSEYAREEFTSNSSKSFSELNSKSFIFETQNLNIPKEPKNIKIKSKRVTLNARGVEFRVPLDTFEKLPESRLGKIKSLIENPKLNGVNETLDDLCEKYDLKANIFYFNGDPNILNMILNYLSTSKLHIDERVTLCGQLDLDEFKYWQVDEDLIDSCCRHKFFSIIDDINDKIEDEKDIIKKYIASNNFGTRFFPKARAKVWQVIESKETKFSKVGRLF